MNRYCHILLIAFSTITLAACGSRGAAGTDGLAGSFLHDVAWRGVRDTRAGAEGARHFFDRRPAALARRDDPERYDATGMTGSVHPLRDALPNPHLTPGAVNPDVEPTPQNIRRTICQRGWARAVRPPEDYTERLKRLQIREYGNSDRRLRDYEEDHLVSIELLGSPTSPENLWPEPHNVEGGWGSYAKDRLENRLNHLVCRGELPLADAQRMIATDWIAAYERYIGPTPDNRRLHLSGG